MGYRSEVGLCLTSIGKQELDKALLAAEQTKNPAIEEIKHLFEYAELKQHDETGTVAYCWDWLKWYPEFPGSSTLTVEIDDTCCPR